MPQWKVWILTLVVCCGSAFSVLAQNTPGWQRYNQASVGIDLQGASSLSFSPRKNLWVTHVGQAVISQLDGYEARSFSAPVDGEFRVYESETEQLWALHPRGLQTFDGTKWNTHVIGKIHQEMQSMVVRAVREIPLLPAEQNNVLVLLSDQLIKYDSIQDQSITLFDREDSNVGKFIDLILAADNGIWITAERGVIRLPTQIREIDSSSKNLLYQVPALLNVHQLRDPFEFEGGLAMMGSEIDSSKRVLVRFTNGDWTKTELPNKNLRRCWITPDGRYWGLAVNALYQWTELHPEPVKVAIDPDSHSDVAMDPSGPFFVSGPSGVWRYSPAAWRRPVELAGEPFPVSAFAETSTNGLWFVDGQRLVQVQSGKWVFHPINDSSGKSARRSTDLGVLPSGNIVLVGSEGVDIYDAKREILEHVDGEGRTGLKLLGEIGGELLFVDSEKALVELSDSGWQRTRIEPPDDVIGEWTEFVQSGNGDYWMGGTQGAARNSEAAWSIFSITDGGVADGALAVSEFARGQIWIGGTNSVQVFAGESFSELTSLGRYRSGQPILDRVNTIVPVASGGKLIAAANGLWKEYDRTWLRFDSDDGLPRNISTFHETIDGDRWVGSSVGAYRFFREADRDPPRTRLDDSPESRQVSRGELARFSFGAQDKWHTSRDEQLLYYSWRFDDEEWSAFSDQRRIFRNGSSFSEGTHTFEVRSMDVYENIDPTPVIAQFEIVVPWFQDTRLRGIVILAVLAVLVFAGLAVNRHLRLLRSYTEIEKIVDERTHQLELANRELAHSEKMRSLGTLAAGVAHDFNSILSIIRGSVQIIEANPDNREKVQTRVNRIKSMVEQGSTLVKSMLGFSRADDARLTLNNVDVVVEDTIQLLGDRLPKEVNVSVDAATNLPSVHGNRELVQQIIVNLVLNAVDAMEGVGTLILRCRHAHQLPEHWVLQPSDADDYITISVEDSGSGISADMLSRIFEPFYTTKAFSTRHGTGLGLSMVYEFCKELGYGLTVRSEPNRGTSFNIVIPVLNSQ